MDRIAPEGNYYANWRADELFVIFYNESNDDEKTMKESLKLIVTITIFAIASTLTANYIETLVLA